MQNTTPDATTAVLVSLQGPLIVMSQNRQTIKDRATAETDYKVNLKNEVNIETILRELGEFRAEANERLEHLEKHTGAPTRPPSEPPARERPMMTSLSDAARTGTRAGKEASRAEASDDQGQLAGK